MVDRHDLSASEALVAGGYDAILVDAMGLEPEPGARGPSLSRATYFGAPNARVRSHL